MELLAYPILLILFTSIFTFEVIAPVSKNNCDRRWLIIASAIGLVQMVVSLAIGYLFKDWFHQHSITSVNDSIPRVISLK